MERRTRIKDWEESERPRERLISKGAYSLSDVELLAILIGTGTKDLNVVDLARELLNANGNSLRALFSQGADQIKFTKGIGTSKATLLSAVGEISKRVSLEERKTSCNIKSSASAAALIAPILRDLPHEECWVLYLNRANRLLAKERISIGGVSATVVDIKIILKISLERLASSIILVHNHPSGNREPGEQDKNQTQILRKAAAFFDISLIDHIIIAGDSYFSFADEGLIDN